MVLSGGLVAIIVVAFTLGTGLFATVVACFGGETGWPAFTLFLNLFAVFIVFGCGLAERIADETPSYLQTNDITTDNWYDFGWFVVGSLVFSSFACPLVLAHNRIVGMKISWASSLGAWMSTTTVLLVSVLFLKDKMRKEGKLGNGEEEEEDDDDDKEN